MDSEILRARPVQIALSVFAAAIVLAAWTGSRALQLETTEPAAPPTFATEAALTRGSMNDPVDIGSVVALNLFSPDRSAPIRRYRLGGYADDVPVIPPPPPIVLGTSVAPDNRSFAFCKTPDGPATLVRVGDRIGGHTVRSIERGLVVFTTPAGERLAITASR
jgi:hypothetical protein